MTTENILQEDTICAIATAPGGAIGIIRVSGPAAIAYTDAIFVPQTGPRLSERKGFTLTFGTIVNEHNDIVDEVLVSLFHAPHSYTGENATEISCHGSAFILQQVIQQLIRTGCRMAKPGEYTQRAFLNGKMDLSQAEAVADLIAASSAASHRIAMLQMRGGYSRELKGLRDKLLHLTSLLELELDFSDHEDLEFADRHELSNLLDNILKKVNQLTDSFRVGNALKNGIPVAIIGATNVGKSTLLNALLNEEKAIVSDVQGTTRDVIEDTINIGGITFRFIDTAGIRHTTDRVEQIGITRTYESIKRATVILWVIDPSEDIAANLQLYHNLSINHSEQILILLFNKCDLLSTDDRERIMADYAEIKESKLFISAKHKENIATLQDLLLQQASLSQNNQDELIVTNARHYEALLHTQDALTRVRQDLDKRISTEFISQDIRECLTYLGEIIGEITSDDVLHNIFKHFCIGK